MGAEYGPAIDIWMPPGWAFSGALQGLTGAKLTVVIHKTAGFHTAQEVANYFINDTRDKKSAHFIVGQDGTVVQCVHLVDGAGANCCPDDTHDPYWNPSISEFVNLNLCTLSIEHVDPALDNSTPLTPAQQIASFQLVKWLIQKFTIPPGHIKGHNSINATACPGNYPLSALEAYVTDFFTVHEAPDCWNSVIIGTLGRLGAPMGTGIYKAWIAAWQAGHQFGPPLTYEYKSVKSDGTPIICQQFAGARCEWDGLPHWYTAQGKV